MLKVFKFNSDQKLSKQIDAFESITSCLAKILKYSLHASFNEHLIGTWMLETKENVDEYLKKASVLSQLP
jgi:glycerol-3-phosphate responsive antiterminator